MIYMPCTPILLLIQDTNLSTQISANIAQEDVDIHQVTCVSSLESCMDEIYSLLPKVIISDLQLENETEISALQFLLKIAPNAAVIAVVENHQHTEQLLKIGAQDCLTKQEALSGILPKCLKYSVERKYYKDRLRETENIYSELFDKSPLPIFKLIGSDLQIQHTNSSAENLFGLRKRDLIGRKLEEFNLETGSVIRIDSKSLSFRKKLLQVNDNGDMLHTELIGNRLVSGTNEFIALIVDRTAEVEFSKKKEKIIRLAEEKEKKNIAMELHDGLAQKLVLMSLWFNSFHVDPNQKALQEDFKELLTNSIKDLKALSYSLRPPELDKGFLTALNNLITRVNHLKQAHVILHMEEDISESDFLSTDVPNLFRILQEFVNNSLKHAEASVLKIEISRKEDDSIFILIEDNGKGFDMHHSLKGLGIQNMETRINTSNLFGNFESSIGNGTKLYLHLPLTKIE
jgi:PAS domain S-box-containing protein